MGNDQSDKVSIGKIEPRREKSGPRGFRPGLTQTVQSQLAFNNNWLNFAWDRSF